jgi:hypothetical protein
MTLYAIPVAAVHVSAVRAQSTCYQTVQTVAFQPTFHIVGLAAGDYYVLAAWYPAVVAASDAQLAHADRSFGGAYTKAVACGLDVTCIDHSLLPVHVQAGQITSGVSVTDWYADRGFYPEVPTNAPKPLSLEPEPSAFTSARDAATYYLQLVTGGRYVQAACPANRACVSIASQHDGDASAYFLATAGSNTELLSCGVYVSKDSAGWHNSDVRCTPTPAVFPAVGATGVVAGLMVIRNV